MDCPLCDRELYLDRVDQGGLYWYVCLNPQCPKYRKSFNPGSGVETPATIKPKEFAEVVNMPEPDIDITD